MLSYSVFRALMLAAQWFSRPLCSLHSPFQRSLEEFPHFFISLCSDLHYAPGCKPIK